MLRLPDPRLAELPPNFVDKIEVDENGCWIWTGASAKGYGTGFLYGRQVTIHIAVYRILVGLVPPSLVLDHRCQIKLCCNPDHLEPVTQQVNVHRAGRRLPFVWRTGVAEAAS